MTFLRIFFLALLVALSGCATVARGLFPLATDPAPIFFPTTLDAWFAASIVAYQEGGEVYEIEDTGSMEPTLIGGDIVVVAPKPWAEYVPFKNALYDPEWLPISSPPALHRIVGRDARGLIMQGDASPFPESEYRVTEAKAHGILVGIWRVVPAKP